MKISTIWITGYLIALLLVACAQPRPADPAAGAALLKPFKTKLQGALKTGLAEDPASAISVCKIRAPKIALEQSVNGVRMGRSSHRLRNPDNQAPAWVQPLMADYLADPASRLPKAVILSDQQHGYIEPIVLQEVCVMCHGHQLAPGIAAQIKTQYPMDKAVGFKPGDLRGVFWVEYPAPDTAP